MNTNSVNLFLNHFKEKMKIFNIVFRNDRRKNAQALVELEITQFDQIKILENLKVDDYAQGPIADKLNHYGEMWVFGKMIKNKEVYIKIAMGAPNSSTICISFHLAEHPLNYPLKI